MSSTSYSCLSFSFCLEPALSLTGVQLLTQAVGLCLPVVDNLWHNFSPLVQCNFINYAKGLVFNPIPSIYYEMKNMKSTTLSNCSIEIDKNAQSSEIEIDHLVKLLDLLLQLLTMNARQVHSARSVFDLLLQRRVVGRNYFGEFLKVLNVYSGFSVCCTKTKRYD